MDKGLRNPLAIAASAGDYENVKSVLEMMKGSVTPKQLEEAIKRSSSDEITLLLTARQKGAGLIHDASVMKKLDSRHEKQYAKMEEKRDMFREAKKTVKETTEKRRSKDSNAMQHLLGGARTKMRAASTSYISEDYQPGNDMLGFENEDVSEN